MNNDSPQYPRGSNKGLHPRNLHRKGYDFAALCTAYPPLTDHLICTAYGNTSINYADPAAVKHLNTALLIGSYGIRQWDIPQGFLCPPIPGRVDYIHYVADLLKADHPTKKTFALLDVGTGANGIYSLLASQVYGWTCTASDIDPLALSNVTTILVNNPTLETKVTLRLQTQRSKMFAGIILPNEYYDVTVCNPPFHASLEEALKGSQRKNKNLTANRQSSTNTKASTLNFGGQQAELWCKGGESKFIRMMIKESLLFAHQCQWFTTLVSKADNLAPAKKLLCKKKAAEIKEIAMHQGNKITRILAWRYR
ncbi:23S rRNA (adenine(1618)-N(6))-methyltransferase RlmF [Marinagarivorans algicola]|uniref:23S rRNA (adenine(1618)-N(6))-methyltransferase RlmF n=1 Tax=Marinagarivorans algicola TaxID=1513270 RepID=UPI0006B95AF9|nr:23S rRNA (adenine(1618)-N(6))-methyltransferase RlmF [Marinagarivorans algicola]